MHLCIVGSMRLAVLHPQWRAQEALHDARDLPEHGMVSGSFKRRLGPEIFPTRPSVVVMHKLLAQHASHRALVPLPALALLRRPWPSPKLPSFPSWVSRKMNARSRLHCALSRRDSHGDDEILVSGFYGVSVQGLVHGS